MSVRARPSSVVSMNALETLEERSMLSGGLLVGGPRAVAHADHVRHVHHVRHLRHLRQVQQAAVTQSRVTTDKGDYVPGEKAVVQGSGFRANEAVRLQVLHIDGTPNGASQHRPWTVKADAHGRFVTSYPVGPDDLNTTLELTAIGAASGRVAKHVFTDAVSATTTTLTSSVGSSMFGQAVTFTATSTGGSSTATGTVTFKDGATTLGTGTLSGGKATLTTSALAAGSHSITAIYGGDSRHGASTSAALAQSVAAAQTTVTVTSSTSGQAGSAPVLRPDHVVIVVEEDRATNAVGDPRMPYFNQLAASGLVFTNSDDLNTPTQEGQMDYLALYSGSTQGVTDNGYNYSFNGPNLGASLNSVAGMSFVGYSESLPSDGSQVAIAGDATYPDLYMRHYNPMAMFTNAGPGKTNADVNKTFAAFPSNFTALPTVAMVVPNSMHSTHGSNEAFPWAGGDPDSYDILRTQADTWLKNNLDPYLQWAKTHNSLLIVTGDEVDRQHPGSITTIVNGDPRLFVAGTDAQPINPYNILRTIEDMYGLTPLGNTATVPGLDTNAQGKLGVPSAPTSGTSTAGQSITFSAKVAAVAPGSGNAPGTVQFKVDGVNFGSPVSVVNGVATSAATSSLGGGAHAVTAVYTPSGGNYTGSTSGTFTQTVTGGTQQAASTTTVASSVNPSTVGQSITFTANVTGSGSTPTGTVTFKDGAATLGSGALGAGGVATFTTSALSTGSHSITAEYSGDTNFTASVSSALSQSVNPVAAVGTSTDVTSSAPTTVVGQSVSFTATVTPASGSTTPTGTVQFKVDGNNLGSPVTLVNGVATSSATTSLSAGSHAVTAVYSGNATFASSTSPGTTQTVNAASTTTTLASTVNPTVFGQSRTVTATVAAVAPGAGTPAGSVQFVVDGANFGSPVALVGGAASVSVSTLAAGDHTIAAVYAGNASYVTSTSAGLTQTVNRAATSTAVTSSANPATVGQSVSFTATVTATAPGAGTPTGTVQFVLDGANYGSPVALVNGKATSAATTTLANGSHTVSAVYAGDANFTASTAANLTQTVSTSSSTAASNTFATRGTLTGSTITATGSNVGATKETGEPSHGGNAGGKSVWWTWTATADGTVTIDTLGSSFDTLLGVYTGSAVNALSTVASNDDSLAGGTSTSKVSFAVTAGTVYQIAVDGYGGASGSITLHLNLALATVPASPTNVAATDAAFSDKVRVTWTAAANATAYEVWRASTNSAATASKLADVNGGATTTYDDTTAVAGTTYYYFLKASSAAGASGFSAGDAGVRAAGATASDLFANRAVLTGTSITVGSSNTGATKETGEPNHGGNVGGKSVW